MIKKRLPYLTALVFLFAVPLRGSPPIGAVVQTWRYDPQAKAVVVTLANTTSKDILAWNLFITETFADGSTSSHEVMTDWLDRMVNAQLAKGTEEEARFTQLFGNGTFAARSSINQEIPEPQAVTNMQIVVDMVAYVDRTADVQNEQAFAQLTASRKGELLALQQANDVIQQAPTREAAAKELHRRITVLHAQNLAPTDPQRYEAGHLEGVARNMTAQQNLDLKTDVAMRQQRIALAGPHTQLTKTKGEGQ
jgi:hypothetical protein